MRIIFHQDGTRTVIDKVSDLGKDRFNEWDEKIHMAKAREERYEQRMESYQRAFRNHNPNKRKKYF